VITYKKILTYNTIVKHNEVNIYIYIITYIANTILKYSYRVNILISNDINF